MTDEGTVAGQVRDHLAALGEPFVEFADGVLQVEAGSTAVFISVQRTLDYIVVELVAPVLVGVEPHPERIVQLRS